MNSILLDDINRKEQTILEDASDKEKFFYAYLTKKAPSVENYNDLGEIDKVCFAASAKKWDSELDAIVERNKRAKPLAGMHFSTNLISLCLFAIYDRSVILNEVQSYFNKHGLKDKFIIRHIFGDKFELKSDIVKTPVEILINEVFVRRKYDEVASLIIQALEACNDPIELFIIKEAYREASEIHPNHKAQNENAVLKKQLRMFTDSAMRMFSIIIGTVFFALIPSCMLIVDYWTDKDLEPKLVAFEFAIILAQLGIYRFFGKAFSLDDIVDNLRLRLVKWWFRVHKLNFTEVQSLIRD